MDYLEFFFFFFLLNLCCISHSFRIDLLKRCHRAKCQHTPEASSVTSLRDVLFQHFVHFPLMESIYLLPCQPMPPLYLWCNIWARCIIIVKRFRISVFLQLLGKLLRFTYCLVSVTVGTRCGNQTLNEWKWRSVSSGWKFLEMYFV